MTKRLDAQDGHAVDLLLHHGTAASQTQDGSSFMTAPTDEVRDRVSQVSNLLNLIHEWPASEPPVDLVQRTLARVASAHAESPRPEAPRDTFRPNA